MIEEMLKTLAASAQEDWFLNYPWNIAALIALTLVALICGATGSLVVAAANFRLSFTTWRIRLCRGSYRLCVGDGLFDGR
jgi:hypothetical protein